MPWDDGLLPEQRIAASHVGANARLLAGPGTGKTRVLTRRIVYLVSIQNIDPQHIVALTFTRAATQELRNRTQGLLGANQMPRISTLHSFALRQLLRNAHRLNDLPQPLRIADDWEERHVILEDLKARLNHDRINQTKELFARLSADWETLQADTPGWTPDPQFLANWQAHRSVFGYTLRTELTYRLKRAMEIVGDFQIEQPIHYLLVDEYQDLNRCDLAVIDGIVTKATAELYVAGDDDQSIYGFRKAHPDGIRNFSNNYAGAIDLPLSTCKRCDPNILNLAEFVAQLDPNRLQKNIHAEAGRQNGIVKILRFADQFQEARSIATLIKHQTTAGGIPPDQTLILLRSDRNHAYSRILQEALDDEQVPVATTTDDYSIFDTRSGRIFVSFLRLLSIPNDDLSYRQLLELRNNSVGDETLRQIYDVAIQRTVRFSTALDLISNDTALVIRGDIVRQEIERIRDLTAQFQPSFETDRVGVAEMETQTNQVVDTLLTPGPDVDTLKSQLISYIQGASLLSLRTLLEYIDQADENIDQEIQPGKVNILTMHRAKGLTSSEVFIVGAEEETIPGRQNQEPDLGDERRLLYVSLTRAEHSLYITYCDRRTGQQRMQGANAGVARRTLTSFLRDAPVHAEDGATYIAQAVQPA